MKLWFKRLILNVSIFIHTWMLRIGSALYNTEVEILKADPEDLNEKNKQNIRQRQRNPIAEKMLQGQRDEQFVQDYYEVLKKADKFLKTASPEKVAMAADKHGLSLGQKDRWGRRHDHYGFFDPKHKNYGMTLGEVMQKEVKERSTDDDDYEVMFMFDNRPITEGLSKTNQIVETEKESIKLGYEAMNEYQKALTRKFPMTVIRNNDNALNKIEQLTDFLHVKRIGSNIVLLEFFIDKKYKLFDNLTNNVIFDEITDFKQVWIKDEYDGRYGFSVESYHKYLDYDVTYDVLKFKATQIENFN